MLYCLIHCVKLLVIFIMCLKDVKVKTVVGDCPITDSVVLLVIRLLLYVCCMYVVCMLCVCCMYVVCMLCVCCVYVVCMLCVCYVYVVCMLYVCCVYVVCMLCVCCVHVVCMLYVCCVHVVCMLFVVKQNNKKNVGDSARIKHFFVYHCVITPAILI